MLFKPCVFLLVDADRAIYLLNAYKTKLQDPREQSLKSAVDRVIGVFNSELFKSLIGLSYFPVLS